MALQMNALNSLPNHSYEHDDACRNPFSSRRESNETVLSNSHASSFRKKRQSMSLSVGSSSSVLERYLKKRESNAVQLDVENLHTSVIADPFKKHFQIDQGVSIKDKRKRGCKAVYQYLSYVQKKFGLRHIFLLLALICYALVGGAIFDAIERMREEEDLDSLNELLIHRISDVSEELISVVLTTKETDPQLEVYSIVRGFYKEMLDLERKLKNSAFDKIDNSERVWDYWSAVFYSATLFTTIGYGTIACASAWGKAITIVYSIIGIPLMLVVIHDLGRVLFFALQKLYNCIYQLCRKVDENDKVERSFPLGVAVPLMFVYLLICAVVIHICDSDDEGGLNFGDSFYFSFMSIAWIGLGDVMPLHIKHSPLVVAMFMFGLVLFSVLMCTIYARMERDYFRAMQVLEETLEELHEEELDEMEEETRAQTRDLSDPIRIAALTAPGMELEHEAARRKMSRIAKSDCSIRRSLRHSLSSIGRRRRGPSCGSNDINSLMPALGVIGFNPDVVREIKELDDQNQLVRETFANSISKSCSDTNLFFHRPRRFNLKARRALRPFSRVHPELGTQCYATIKSCNF